MFKKLLILSLVLIPLAGFAQELTADTPAVEASLLDQILKALLIALVSVLSFVAQQVIPLINQWLKAIMHFRGSSVVADAMTQAFSELLQIVQARGADGSFCDEDRKFLKKRAKEIAEVKLKSLSGFYKKDLVGWLDEVLEVELGKLLSRIFSSSASKIR